MSTIYLCGKVILASACAPQDPHGGGSLHVLIATMLRLVSRARRIPGMCERDSEGERTSLVTTMKPASSGMTPLPSRVTEGGDFAK